MNISELDTYFVDAAYIIVENNTAEISILKEQLKIGTNRVNRILEQLEIAKIISPSNDENRKILVENKFDLKSHLIKMLVSDKCFKDFYNRISGTNYEIDILKIIGYNEVGEMINNENSLSENIIKKQSELQNKEIEKKEELRLKNIAKEEKEFTKNRTHEISMSQGIQYCRFCGKTGVLFSADCNRERGHRFSIKKNKDGKWKPKCSKCGQNGPAIGKCFSC